MLPNDTPQKIRIDLLSYSSAFYLPRTPMNSCLTPRLTEFALINLLFVNVAYANYRLIMCKSSATETEGECGRKIVASAFSNTNNLFLVKHGKYKESVCRVHFICIQLNGSYMPQTRVHLVVCISTSTHDALANFILLWRISECKTFELI